MQSYIVNWDEQDVFNFFSAHGFPTQGLRGNCVNGPALLMLYSNTNALELFTSPAPDGLGFERISYIHLFRRAIRDIMGDEENIVNLCGMKRTIDDAFDDNKIEIIMHT